MPIRIPHGNCPTEIVEFCQEMEWHSRPLTDGAASGQLLVGAGANIAPIWTDQVAIDHGGFGGLLDDTHTQYHTDARGDARYYTQTLLDAGQLDNRYFTEAEHLSSSAGAGDAGKPIKLDAGGRVDASMVSDGDVDHGSIGGLEDVADHPGYLLIDGSRNLTGNLAVTAEITIDGRDLSEDGAKLDLIEAQADVTDATNVAAAGAAMSGGAFHDGFSDYDANDHIDHTSVLISTAAGSGLSGGGTIASTRTLVLNIDGLTGESGIVAADTIPFYDDGVGNRKVTFAEFQAALGVADEKVKVDVDAAAGYLGVAAGDGVLRTSSAIAWTDGGDYVTLDLSIDGLGAEAAIAAADTIPFFDATAAGNRKVTFAQFEGVLSHDALADYDANKHVDHTSVSISTGSGLTGGGDISTTRTLALNIAGLTPEITIVSADILPFYDVTASANRRLTFAQFEAALSHDNLAGIGTDNHHAESHSVASHSDTTATGAELETLTDNSVANALHRHSELVASDGAPDPALAVDADGAITIGGSLGVTGNITGPNVTTGANPGHTHTGGVSGIDTVTELENNGSMAAAICHVVYSDGDGTFDFVDVSDPDKSNAIGLCTETINMGNTGFIRVGGVLSAAAGFWTAVGAGGSGLTPGAFYYASTTNAGWITDTRPTDPAYGIVRLGIALSTTDLSIDIQEAAPVLELLDTDATVYVDTAGNDSTGLGTSGAPFATLGKALSSLSTRVIASDVTITIQLGDGTYTSTSATEVGHPNGDRINVVGENTYDKTLSSIQSSSGSAGAWLIILNLDNVTNIAVGDYLIVPTSIAGGAIPSALWGCWKITNVDAGNSRVTVSSTGQYVTAPSGAVAGTVTVIKTVLQFNGSHGLQFAGGVKLGKLDKLVLAGNDTASTFGIHLQSLSDCNASFGAFGVVHFAYGSEINFNSVLRISTGYVCSCARGINVVNGTIQGNNAIISGNTAYGMLLLQGSAVIQGAVVVGNDKGIDAQTGSSVVFAGTGKVWLNTGIGIKASNTSFVFFTTSTFNTNGTNASPVVNTEGNILSYIKQ